MTDDLAVRVEQACQQLLTDGAEVAFGEVATRVGIGRATLWVPRTLTLPPTSAITVSRRTSCSP